MLVSGLEAVCSATLPKEVQKQMGSSRLAFEIITVSLTQEGEGED